MPRKEFAFGACTDSARIWRRRITSLVVMFLAIAVTVHAQQTSVTVVTVVDQNRQAVTGARVDMLGPTVDTTLTTDGNGLARLAGVDGQLRITVRAIGYQPTVVDIVVSGVSTKVPIVLIKASQQLAAVQVNARASFLNGIVNDAAILRRLSDAVIYTSNGGHVATTDSAGRFTIQIDKAKPIVLIVEHKGYESRSILIQQPIDTINDFIVHLIKGKSTVAQRTALIALRIRTAFPAKKSLVVSAEDLGTPEETLYDALNDSKVVKDHGLRLAYDLRVLQEGIPSYGLDVKSVMLRDIAYVELYPSPGDNRRTLLYVWNEWGLRARPTYLYGKQVDYGPSSILFLNIWYRH